LASAAFAQTPLQTAPKKTPSTAARKTLASRPSLYRPSSLKDRAPETFRAKFVTTQGAIVVEVTRALAPLGADRFYNLVKYGFYNGNAFFRVVPGFVVQFGLSPTPAINAAWENANIKDDPIKSSNVRGTLCFATSGANTRTTQLFINLGNNVPLDNMGFAAFGKVVEGLDVVDKIYSGYGEKPDQPKITRQGAAYLKAHFPQLDSIKTATIE
jgi:peptidyl-prolyl cis-trans isomerase A (cyclophilin A)